MRTLFVAILLAFCCTAVPSAAQVVRGTVLQEGTRTPVPATLLVLLDESGRQVGGALSDDSGGFLIRAPGAGRYRIRVQRIGYENTLSAVFDLSAGETVEQQILAPVTRIEGITVEARSRCAIRPDVGRSTAALWEEARKALQAAAFTESSGLYRFRVRRYQRDLDLESRISGEEEEIGTVANNRPFAAHPAEYLLERGFVEHDAAGTTYYAPDADVLLSDAFLEEYCFQAVSGDSGRIGLSFRPVSSRGPPAVRGTLWIDRESLELRWLEYGYTRVELPDRAEQRVGGRIEFESLPSGAWIVRRWWIRMPSRVTTELVPAPPPIGSRSQGIPTSSQGRMTLSGMREEGGDVLEVFEGIRTLRSAPRGSISGVVHDSAHATPLVGATVYLSGTGYSAVTDADGRFRIDALPEGEYALAFMHPRLSAFGIYPAPLPVGIRIGDESFVSLGVPANARREAILSRCSESPRPADQRDAGVLVGQVQDARTGSPVPGAEVRLTWLRFELHRIHGGEDLHERSTAVVTRTASDGTYLACGIAKNRTIAVQITSAGEVVYEGSENELGEDVAYAERDFLTRSPGTGPQE